MLIKSNITISSNIYNRTNKSVENDVEFVKNVSGHEALTVLKSKLRGALINAKLSDIQLEEQLQGTSCSKAKSGEVTHGQVLIDGKIKWVCRCEYINCSKLCSERKSHPQIVRKKTENNFIVESSFEFDSVNYEYLGLDFTVTDIGEIIEPPTSTQTISSKIDSIYVNKTTEAEPAVETSKFDKVAESTIIIKADINSKILVNAGPGTGKTYTVIQRILYIIKNELASPDCVLILCYTRAAKAVIIGRIEQGIAEGSLTIEANTLNVCTFDSFATSYLAVIEEQFENLDYNKRIELFNKTIEKNMFDYFEYLIVDEMQDLVNERAIMVLNILKSINCGFLLLGDRCQAIYDYDCGDDRNIDSTKFYKMLYDILPDSTCRYELIKNNRQNNLLANFSHDIRQVLLNSGILKQNEFVSDAMKSISVVQQNAEKFIPETKYGIKTAILCRNNGEAEYISSYLHSKGNEHTLLRGAKHSVKLHRWIADMFWDYCEIKIGKSDFLERYLIRVNDNSLEAENRFNVLCSVSNSKDNELKMSDLITEILKSFDIPLELINIEKDTLTVSTIHRAKGREFDKVYLLQSDFLIQSQNAEEARVRYVAITRPKTEIEIVKKGKPYKWYFAKSDNGRGIRTAIKPYFKNQTYCTNIVIGLNDDIDNIGFVSEKSADSLTTQQYIAEKINVNDKVELIRDPKSKIYSIYHKGNVVGTLSDEIVSDFWNAINKTGDKRNIPVRLYDIYVSNIITVVNKRFDENIPLRFRESKIWLGIEITGFARTEYLS
ncbi:MAG: UvrD-helicase domain-containing protein [Clostridium sp.]|uniref:UvrD-helicase domain-containing protein n=1 Tax=Clostridium sp. TaxID=1506 RepID=UPI003D6D5722